MGIKDDSETDRAQERTKKTDARVDRQSDAAVFSAGAFNDACRDCSRVSGNKAPIDQDQPDDPGNRQTHAVSNGSSQRILGTRP